MMIKILVALTLGISLNNASETLFDSNKPTLPSHITVPVCNKSNLSILSISKDPLILISRYLRNKEILELALSCERLAILFGATRYIDSPLEQAFWLGGIVYSALEGHLTGTDLVNLKRILGINTAYPTARALMILGNPKVTIPQKTNSLFYDQGIQMEGFMRNQRLEYYSSVLKCIINAIPTTAVTEPVTARKLVEIYGHVACLNKESSIQFLLESILHDLLCMDIIRYNSGSENILPRLAAFTRLSLLRFVTEMDVNNILDTPVEELEVVYP